MTTTLDKTYSSTGNQIIQDAYEHLRVKQKGQALDSDDQAQAERYLNNIIKDLQKDGLFLWKEQEAAVFFEPSRRTYQLGNQSTFVCTADSTPSIDNRVYATEGDWVATTLSADATAAQAVVNITALSAYSGTTFNTTCNPNVIMSFDAGTNEPTIGDAISGGTSGATGTITAYTLVSGTWAGNDAVGTLTVNNITGSFVNDDLWTNTTESETLATQNGTAAVVDDTDYIKVGIVLDDGTIQWSTMTSISTLALTLIDDITSLASSGNRVYLYRDHLDKPLKILKDNARVWQSATSETPIYLQSFTDYNLLADKGSTGFPVNISYSPKIDTGDLAIWPISDSLNNVLLFRYMAGFDIFDGTATQDAPPEWTRTLGWLLAAELGMAKGIPLPRQQYIDAKAGALKEDLLDWDMDSSSMYLQPRLWG
jgi:hypothetical protein